MLSSDSNHKEWVVQPAPPLCEKRQVRPKIFGFPVTEDDLYTWAVKHYTRPGGSLCVRRNAAWTAICVRLPTDHRHVTTIRDQLPDDPEFRRRDQLECRRFGAHQDTELIKSFLMLLTWATAQGGFTRASHKHGDVLYMVSPLLF